MFCFVFLFHLFSLWYVRMHLKWWKSISIHLLYVAIVILFYGHSKKTHFKVIMCHFHIVYTMSCYNYQSDNWKGSSTFPSHIKFHHTHIYNLNHASFFKLERIWMSTHKNQIAHNEIWIFIYIYWWGTVNGF